MIITISSMHLQTQVLMNMTVYVELILQVLYLISVVMPYVM